MQDLESTPPAFPLEDPSTLRAKLRQSTRDCTERGLTSAAKWTAELLQTLPPVASTSTLPTDDHFRTSTPVRTRPSTRQSLPGLPPMSTIAHARPRDSLGSVMEMGGSSPAAHVGSGLNDTMEEDEDVDEEDAEEQERKEAARRKDDEEQDIYLLALSYYRVHEHLRAAHVLQDCSGPKARWLRTYARFLAGQKRVQEEGGEILGVKDKGVPNPHSVELLADMEAWEAGAVANDGWLLFMKALLLLSLPPTNPAPLNPAHSAKPSSDLRLDAMEILVQSVNLEPYNWSAWLKLASVLDGPEELAGALSFLPKSFATLFFFVHATLEIHSATASLHQSLDRLSKLFGECPTIKGMRALIHYHIREFDEATAHFTELREADPFRIEDIDTFSNILYVSEKRAELAMLAQEYAKIDRARPETCCLIGNYYSLRREHEKAIIYFGRALKLDRGYLSAWTLMGHEYVEIKNTNAAIASYRKAVDVNRKDYRAWYGLGQTYELLGEPFYAINYYQKATSLRPYDARMWSALAVCYEKLKRIPDAIKAYQRALISVEPGDNDTAIRIGRLYALIGDSTKAAQYHRRALYEGVKVGLPKNQLSKIYLWLAQYEIQKEKAKGDGADEGDLVLADGYLREAITVQEDKEEANGLLKELQSLQLSRK
ncbi:TPR-like protein [Meredithblackwellia eburnea MCA 4105]